MISSDFFAKQLADRALAHAYILIGNAPTAAEALAADVAVQYRIVSFDQHILCPEEEKKAISIAAVRALRARLSFKPHSSSHHLVIIPNAAAMTPEAQSALLKILEEPVAPTIFLLGVADEQLLLPTVVSRCQRVRIGKEETQAGEGELLAEIIKRPLSEQFRLAEQLAQDPTLIAKVDRWIIELRRKLKLKDIRTVLAVKEKFITTQVNKRLLLEDLFLALRRMP